MKKPTIADLFAKIGADPVAASASMAVASAALAGIAAATKEAARLEAEQATPKRTKSKRFAGHLGKTPCGRPCCLRRDRAHVYCTCVDGECRLCHAPSRFGRATVRYVEPAQPREGVR